MPAKRNANAAKKAVKKNTPAYSAGIMGGSTKNDILGVVGIVIAIALALSLFSTSQAIITMGVRTGLVKGFGAGAMLVPVAIFLFSLTFFVDSDIPLSARAAIGLSLIVVAILAMLSIGTPSAEFLPNLVLEEPALSTSGGYVGGGIAWVLLRLVGRTVGLVILWGIVVAGIVICGFSITELVSRIRGTARAVVEENRYRFEDMASDRAARRAEREAAREAAREEARARKEEAASKKKRGTVPQAALFDENGEAVTTFIGDRKTSVLRRDAEPETHLLRNRDGYDADELAGAEPLSDEAYESLSEGRGSVPDFLEQPTEKKTRKKSAAKTTRKSTAKEDEGKRPGDSSQTIELPPLSILRSNPNSANSASSKGDLQSMANRLQATLEEFGSASKVVGWTAGPSVTTFKISMGEGERVAKISNLEDDIALSLAARNVRIFSPIPGTSLVGIEIPNESRQSVCLGDVLPYAQGGPLEAGFGRDAEGNPIVVDLAALPHLLVAGTTGSGKSVMLNSIIVSILMRATPEQVRFIMIDPKRVEFADYAGLPHLYVPVVTEPRQATSALQWAVTEMERRLKVFERHSVREIKTFNAKVASGAFKDEDNPPENLPYFVIVIDELSDLMMVSGKEVEASIVRIAQLGRAAGIHLVVATQRPSADVVTGLIKANIDNRVALSVDNGMNSRIILDQNGAERLLGNGDMLIKLRGRSPKRAQGCFVSDDEIKKTVGFIKNQQEAEYHNEILSMVSPGTAAGGGAGGGASDDDPLVWEAAALVVDSQLGSTSALQRHLKVGYARAGRIMDMLEQKGIVGPPDGSKPREVLLDAAGLEELRAAETEYQEV